MLSAVTHYGALAVLPITLLILWLIAELRWRRRVRVALAMANVFLLLSWLIGVIYTYDLVTGMYEFSLSKMDRLLEEQHEAKVHHALRVHNETLQQTGSAKRAVFRLSSALLELEAEPAVTIPGPERQRSHAGDTLPKALLKVPGGQK